MADGRDIELNPRFLVPPAVIDVRQENNEDSYLYYGDGGADVVRTIDGPVLEYSDAPIPNAPASYSIVSQTVHIGPDGSNRVDVLLEFPDTSGAYSIDVRVSPA